MKHHIAVVFTCHNRKEKTLNCLEKLHSQTDNPNYQISYYCCDDGSTDGTSQEISEKFPQTVLVQGDGNLFWARGMAAACSEAQKCNPDFYLMINDDVDFSPSMLTIMMQTYEENKKIVGETAVVGATEDKNGNRSYGGLRWKIKGISIDSEFIHPTEDDLSCNVANWNCFLIPKEIYNSVGEIDSAYEHGLADFDYSLRIVKNGFHIYSTNQFIGVCENNPTAGTWMDKTLPFYKRWKLMQKRTAKPWRSDVHFYKKVFGIKWPLFMAKQYVAMIFRSGGRV